MLWFGVKVWDPLKYKFPFMSRRDPVEVIPIQTFPFAPILTRSVLLVRNKRSTESVVPRKFVPAIVPVFHQRFHTDRALQVTDPHEASPFASETRTLPSHGFPQRIWICHATDSLAVPVEVPIQMVPLFQYIQFQILS